MIFIFFNPPPRCQQGALVKASPAGLGHFHLSTERKYIIRLSQRGITASVEAPPMNNRHIRVCSHLAALREKAYHRRQIKVALESWRREENPSDGRLHHGTRCIREGQTKWLAPHKMNCNLPRLATEDEMRVASTRSDYASFSSRPKKQNAFVLLRAVRSAFSASQ